MEGTMGDTHASGGPPMGEGNMGGEDPTCLVRMALGLYSEASLLPSGDLQQSSGQPTPVCPSPPKSVMAYLW